MPAIDDVEPTQDSSLWRNTAEFYRVNKKALNRMETEVRQAVAQWQEVVARTRGRRAVTSVAWPR